MSPKQASKHFSVHVGTPRERANNGKIKTEPTKNGQRRHITHENPNETQICHCRISSHKQKNDLERQIQLTKGKYPNAKIIKDIGSSPNLKKRPKTLLERTM